ncbi:Ureidoglycolate lyase [Lachnellula hyalina]|uniref:Ureidoglycolate lyase n=1 Tax=Lachnellula hyalina TaxID=1316788 RepID=A0A8H8TYZ1_9HELO|nr:Ureidoglycolate lyase [Lachnellula hyalina]TVY25870.1 Ureidoglycolate lyase [Lachnellula hyalina]
MPVEIDAPQREPILEAHPLSQDLFSEFGTVIENPAPSLVPSQTCEAPPNAVQANQGSALKYLDVTHMRDLYASGTPSKKAAKAVMNMFVCAPRVLLPSDTPQVEGLFPVNILERHPYTTQTFIPLGLSRAEAKQSRYLVIVAPSFPPSPKDECFPVPSITTNGDPLPGRGLPDLMRIKAFIANGSQAVTYGAGTWHAPMVAIGKYPIAFVVVQFANGVGIEDCQEVEIGRGRIDQLQVAVPASDQNRGLWRL